VKKPVYDELINAQTATQRLTKKADLQRLLTGNKSWVVA